MNSKMMKLDEKATRLKDLLTDAVDAMVDAIAANDALSTIERKLPPALIAALDGCLRVEQAACASCGAVHALRALDDGRCADCVSLDLRQ